MDRLLSILIATCHLSLHVRAHQPGGRLHHITPHDITSHHVTSQHATSHNITQEKVSNSFFFVCLFLKSDTVLCTAVLLLHGGAKAIMYNATLNVCCIPDRVPVCGARALLLRPAMAVALPCGMVDYLCTGLHNEAVSELIRSASPCW